MGDKRIPQIPLPTLKRLPVYYQYLTRQARKGVTDISCASIAKAMGLVAVQVRKDLQLTGAVGRPKTGYRLKELLEALERTLGYDNKTEMFLVGVGSLGKALLHYRRFGDYNIGIAAAFDVSEDVIGTEIDGKPVLPFRKFPSLCRRLHVKFGIICVPAEAAQEVANIMVSSGIEAIWNFAPITLELPDMVIVHNENLTASLSILLKKYKTQHTGSERE
ncbi:MAG: redox-sensing transcriptional repressor Rex [Clostridiales bacterium]|nr:redox-sensing transcriptional repressor Rex [Clostridiales bacterium]